MELAAIITYLRDKFPGAILETPDEAGHILVEPEKWFEIASALRDDPDLNFDSLMCITAWDEGSEGRIGVAYNLFSMTLKHTLEVRLSAAREAGEVPSVVSIWPTADWHEREAFDLLGVHFIGHPDLRRILLPFDWVGHPLRKDYKEPDSYLGMPVPKDKRGWE